MLPNKTHLGRNSCKPKDNSLQITLRWLIVNYAHGFPSQGRGWSNVKMGITLYFLECLDTKLIVEYMQLRSLGFKSIIGRNTMSNFPGYSPIWQNCINLDQPGRCGFSNQELFHKKSTFEVKS